MAKTIAKNITRPSLTKLISDKNCWKEHYHAFQVLPQRDLPMEAHASDLIWDIQVL